MIDEAKVFLTDNGWTDVSATPAGHLVSLAGLYRGQAHSGAAVDGLDLARRMHEIATSDPAAAPLAAREPEAPRGISEESIAREILAGVLADRDVAPSAEVARPAAAEDAVGADVVAAAKGAYKPADIAPGHIDTSDYADPANQGVNETPVAYSGVALVRDELGFLRNHVQAKIVAGLLLRLDANADESRLAWLAQALSDYMNLREQRAPISEQVQKNYDEWVEWKDFKSNIIDGAVALMRAAEHADMPMLQAMAVNPWTAG